MSRAAPRYCSTLLKLALGVLIGTVVVGWFGWSADQTSMTHLSSPPDWFRWPALLAAAFSFGVLFSARWKELHIAMLAAIVSYLVSRIGVAMGGLEFGVLLASMSVAVLANLYGRFFKQTLPKKTNQKTHQSQCRRISDID